MTSAGKASVGMNSQNVCDECGKKSKVFGTRKTYKQTLHARPIKKPV